MWAALGTVLLLTRAREHAVVLGAAVLPGAGARAGRCRVVPREQRREGDAGQPGPHGRARGGQGDHVEAGLAPRRAFGDALSATPSRTPLLLPSTAGVHAGTVTTKPSARGPRGHPNGLTKRGTAARRLAGNSVRSSDNFTGMPSLLLIMKERTRREPRGGDLEDPLLNHTTARSFQ